MSSAMRTPHLHTLLAWLGALVLYAGEARSAGVEPEVFGEFDANYRGNDTYYYNDPYAEKLPLAFETADHKMTCKATRSRRFEVPYHGVALGGFLVLEPWITPSLFYQFLGTPEEFGADAPEHTALDMYSFCTVLGPEEGNKQLRRHWRTWVTEEDFIRLHSMKVNAVRIPVGDWMWRPYGPYVNCTAGALFELDRALSLAHKYGMRAIIDLHGVKDSQNGFDNSGMMSNIEWTQEPGMPPMGQVQSTFSHWALQSPGWIGKFDRKSWKTVSLNWGNVDAAIDVLCMIAEMYKDHPAVFGLQPLNEPWQHTPIGPLQRFYFEGYKAVKRRAPKWKYVMSDSFRPNVDIWSPFMTGCPGAVISVHLHQAWMSAGPLLNFMINACDAKHQIAALNEDAMDVIVGEWSLATDNCAMWLNGFNDNLPGFPTVECPYLQCPDPYMGTVQPGTPPDPAKYQQGPFGTGMSTPRHGMCPVDKPWPDDDVATRRLAYKKLNAFQGVGGWFFWNFKTELESKWSYMHAVDRGWIPRDPNGWSNDVDNACDLEDRSGFKCQLKHGANPALIVKAVNYACAQPGMEVLYCFQDANYRLQHASRIMTQHWKLYHRQGSICDFDGIAELLPDYTYGIDPSIFSHQPYSRLSAHAASSVWKPALAVLSVGLVAMGLIVRRAVRGHGFGRDETIPQLFGRGEITLREPLTGAARVVEVEVAAE